MAPDSTQITIVGAGIVGIATAIYLRRDGHHVTVVDRDLPGQGTSFGNAGSIAPSSIVPMALPGTFRSVPKWIVDPLGPLTLSWRRLPALLRWFLHFRRACTAEGATRSARALKSINGPSIENYRELLSSAGAPDLLRTSGMLHVYRSTAAFERSAFGRQLRIDNDALVEIVGPSRIQEIEPALSSIYRCGFFLPDNGHVTSPLRVVEALARHFVESGGEIVRATVERVTLSGRRPVAIRTDQGELGVDHVVIAAGIASQRLAAQIGTRVVLAPERGYHIEITDGGVALRCPVTDGDARFVATPMENGLRLAGTSEFEHADAPANWQRSEALGTLGVQMLPRLRTERYTRWMGTRPSTPDSLPIIGPAPSCERVYFAFGHGHFGLMAAPATGQVIADLVAGRSPRIDIAPFRADRFS